MIPRLKPAIQFKEIIAAMAIWRRHSVEAFENEFKSQVGSTYALSFSYGRSAIYSILKALCLEGREVICPSYTCVVVPHAIVIAGCVPVFVDSNPNDFNMDLDLVESAITNETVAIIATSLFGHPVDLTKLAKIKRRYPHIIIIQDCAHSFITYHNDQAVHLAGDFAIFAFNISKIITSIFGGMLVTESKTYFQKIKNFREKTHKPKNIIKGCKRFIYLLSVFMSFNRIIYGFINYLEQKGFLDKFVKYFDPQKINMPADYLDKLAPIEGRVGSEQSKKIKKIISHRKKIAEIYFQHLKGIESMQLPPFIEGASYSHFVIRCKDARSIINLLHKNKVQAGELIDYHIPNLPVYKKYQFISQKVAENWPNNVLNLPVHTGITEKDAFEIINIIRKYINSLN